MSEVSSIRIPVTERNLWYLERSIPLFDHLDFFPADALGPPAMGRSREWRSPVRKLTIETDQGWQFKTDISSDQKVFRNSSKARGTGKWIANAGLRPGDHIVIRRLDSHRYFLTRERGDE